MIWLYEHASSAKGFEHDYSAKGLSVSSVIAIRGLSERALILSFRLLYDSSCRIEHFDFETLDECSAEIRGITASTHKAL